MLILLICYTGGGHQCNYCGRMFSQPKTLVDHELKHRQARHTKTTDPKRRSDQLITEKRGRKSLADTIFGVGETLASSSSSKKTKKDMDTAPDNQEKENCQSPPKSAVTTTNESLEPSEGENK